MTAQQTATAASPASIEQQGCRFCGAKLNETFVDLGMSPLCENWLTPADLEQPERFYPLHAFVCDECYLVQVKEYVSGEEIFGGEYAYFSSYSDSWLAHIRKYVENVSDRLELNQESRVVELASNDGYLLQYFVERDIPCLGVEPASNCAEAARAKGVPTRNVFFGCETADGLASEGWQADLVIGNNVLAHVPDINDFVGGIRRLLAPGGVNTMEFPHLMRLVEGNQFDTIYQEHYCYLSLIAVQAIYAAHRMVIFDVEEIPTHGGSLRIYARRVEDASLEVHDSVTRIVAEERAAGYDRIETYRSFSQQVVDTKNGLLNFLLRAKAEGKTVAGYGAPGKATTLLNYCGVRGDFIEYMVDRNPYKHGRYMPGTRIPVLPVEQIAATKPDYVLILPWNLKDEIAAQLSYVCEWGGQLVCPIPEVTILN
ncbi:MAG: class I SAM-dependent methyltransferase [Pirellulaceae bacterium]|nr:class I SAM-dependent methyltransferase [Pirellulaceae bacterium]